MTTNSSNKIHNQLNPYFRTRQNPNWKALIESIGDLDEETATLIQEVRKQFFIQTAERPYIDRLAANLRVQRPRLVGMDDETFRRYIPIMAYQPKQVKLIMDKLLDVFFFREATTAFTQSQASEPFNLEDGWELTYTTDGVNEENIRFLSQDFTSITEAKAEEIAASINRQAKFSFAVVFDDRILKNKYIRVFTNTVGSKGSIEVFGGRSNIALQFNGTIAGAGSGLDTQWSVTKVGDTTTFQHVGGVSPNLNLIQRGDVAVIDLQGNSGSFEIVDVDLSSSSFSFLNLFAVPGTYDHAILSNSYVRFIRPTKSIVWNKANRALVWEVSPGEAIIEMPATPPVVRRSLKGSAHLNGLVGQMTDRPNNASITLADATEWPSAGMFVMAPKESIDMHILTPSLDTTISTDISGRYDVYERKYTYTGKLGNSLTGITPELPRKSEVVELPITSISRTSSIATAVTATPHNLVVGQGVRIIDVVDSTFNLSKEVLEVLSTTSFTYISPGADGSSSNGYVRSEFVGLSVEGSSIYLTSAKINTGVLGPYLWDESAAFVLSSYTSKTVTDIRAGNIVLNLQIEEPNNIPSDQGFLIFDYGLETQEGPVRYLYKASESVIALDPSYVFKFDHTPGSAITAIRRKGGHVLSGLGTEYPFYVSDPAAARLILQDLILSVKSVGVFLRFIIRFPTLFYGTLDTYQSGVDPG